MDGGQARYHFIILEAAFFGITFIACPKGLGHMFGLLHLIFGNEEDKNK